MKRVRNKRIEIGLPEVVLSHAKVVAKYRGIKLDELILESLLKTGIGLAPVEAKTFVGVDVFEEGTYGAELAKRRESNIRGDQYREAVTGWNEAVAADVPPPLRGPYSEHPDSEAQNPNVEPKVDDTEDGCEKTTEGREIYRRLTFPDKRGPNLDDFDE